MPNEIFKITSAGSVDDGKSTVLARLLLDTGSIYDDQYNKNFDPNRIADLLDGLESELEQGITIDVAHRFFDSKTRRYQIADSPGHEQYTRNMATACAGSDALLLVVDATAGLKPQTKLHLDIALRLGIRDVIFAINKIDLVGFSKKTFDQIAKSISTLLEERETTFGPINHQSVPLSGLKGQNVVRPSSKLSWFIGPTLMEALDGIERRPRASDSAKLIVQYVQRIPGGGRRYLGSLRDGVLEVGQNLFVNGQQMQVEQLLNNGVPCERAEPGSSISVVINRELDVAVGDLLSAENFKSHDQFEVDLIWLHTEKGVKGRKYILKSASSISSASITKISRIDIETNKKDAQSPSILTNEIQRCNLSLTGSLPLQAFDTYSELGRFVLVEPQSGQTVAVGTVNYHLNRSENLTEHQFAVTPALHEQLTGVSGKVFWFTGLSGSGKSTLANKFSQELHAKGVPHFVLDGDNLRLGINRDLGFTEEDRSENIRRTAEIASLMADAGLVVSVALISPYQRDRQMAREIIGAGRFQEIYVATPLEECEKRDPKGLYKKARSGEIPNFTGVSSPYERPDGRAIEVLDFEELVRKIG
ncbi:adenylyl-sulfate kinase [Candidatus Aquiluna sp. IMCC13023]|uniref:adenylyl-sulfate kinase n=1 Tax=Candidatus Aquiluna sp. IMCC13023 TaxID=1081644 RepID=UPI00025B20CF|nr:adenylyl-sulfate kinase [Candidatus Aquiluna sp. IMCC13023]EIC91891.1 adenylyl-sulfate kinase [Candidatus Aquiluna sp. IMCC13023]